MSDSAHDPAPRRRFPPRLDRPALIGIGAGVAVYLIVVFGLGQLTLAVGFAVVILLAVSLARNIRATRASRARLREREHPYGSEYDRPGDRR